MTISQQRVGEQPLIDGLVEEVALRERVRTRYAELAELAASGATCGCGQPVDCGCGAGCCTWRRSIRRASSTWSRSPMTRPFRWRWTGR